MLLFWLSEICLLPDLLELTFTLIIELLVLSKRTFGSIPNRLVLNLVFCLSHETEDLGSESRTIAIEGRAMGI